jgi:hypothetical protein
MWQQLFDAMPDVQVKVVHVPEGGPVLLYRPSRDRPRTDDTPLPCAFDPSYVVGWRCDPRRGAHVHMPDGYAFQDSGACVGRPGCACPTIHNAVHGCLCDCHTVWHEALRHSDPRTTKLYGRAAPVEVPERVDELPPLGDAEHDPAPDQ